MNAFLYSPHPPAVVKIVGRETGIFNLGRTASLAVRQVGIQNCRKGNRKPQLSFFMAIQKEAVESCDQFTHDFH